MATHTSHFSLPLRKRIFQICIFCYRRSQRERFLLSPCVSVRQASKRARSKGPDRDLSRSCLVAEFVVCGCCSVVARKRDIVSRDSFGTQNDFLVWILYNEWMDGRNQKVSWEQVLWSIVPQSPSSFLDYSQHVFKVHLGAIFDHCTCTSYTVVQYCTAPSLNKKID